MRRVAGFLRMLRTQFWLGLAASVAPNCTVVGVPAYIIRRDGKPVPLAGAQRAAKRLPYSTGIVQS